MTKVSKNVYINKVDYIVCKYDHTCRRIVKMTPVDVNQSTYKDIDVQNDDTICELQVVDQVIISK